MYTAFPGPSIPGSELSAGAVRGPLSVMCRSSLPQTLGPKSAGGQCTCQVSQEQNSVDPTAPHTGPACLQPEARAMPGCSNVFLFFVSFFFFFCLFAISWAALTAHGGSQARGQIGARASSLCQSHSNAGSKPRL